MFEYETIYVGDSSVTIVQLEDIYYKNGWEPIMCCNHMDGVSLFTLRRRIIDEPKVKVSETY